MPANAQPTFSHGGSSVGPFPPVPGNAVSSGRPIFIGDAAVSDPAMMIFVTGGNATVFLECNGGLANNLNGAPPAGEWIDVSGGGYALTPTSPIGKFIPRTVPYWRTRISAIDPGATVTSYCPGLRRDTGDFVPASYPPVNSGAQFTTGS